MNCDECRMAQSRFVDGELPPNQSAEMFDHAASCAECRSFFHALVRLNQKIERLPQPGVTTVEELSVGVSEPRAVQVPRLWQRRLSLRIPAFALTVGIVAAVAVLSFAQLRRPEPVYVTELPTLVVSADTTGLSLQSPAGRP